MQINSNLLRNLDFEVRSSDLYSNLLVKSLIIVKLLAQVDEVKGTQIFEYVTG